MINLSRLAITLRKGYRKEIVTIISRTFSESLPYLSYMEAKEEGIIINQNSLLDDKVLDFI